MKSRLCILKFYSLSDELFHIDFPRGKQIDGESIVSRTISEGSLVDMVRAIQAKKALEIRSSVTALTLTFSSFVHSAIIGKLMSAFPMPS